jgi:trehalose 6-phosphate phosphatase
MDLGAVVGRLAADAAGSAPPALFLDFDGTLVELAAHPQAVRPAPDLVPLLATLVRRLGGALAIVTGRPIDEVDRFLAPLRLPIAGLHGNEMRSVPDGTPGARTAVELGQVRDRLGRLAAEWPGVTVEDKGIAIAVHYRAVPDAAGEVRRVAAELQGESADALMVLDGKMVVELVPAGRDKGTAIRELSRAPPFAGRRPVFLGDDVTDEAGFRAVNELCGVSIRVGERDRPTAARYRLDNVVRVLQLLTELDTALAACAVVGE